MKILMISDYNVSLGGIEQYLKDTSQILNSNGHQVTVVGLSLPISILRRMRGLLLIATGCNIIFSIQVLYHIISKKPDIIWRNSVSRYIGRLPLWTAHLFGIKTWMMYHDLGYFHPYPSLLTDVNQIVNPWKLSSRLQAGYVVNKTSIKDRILMCLKFMSIDLTRKMLIKYTSTHLVPSPYMIDIVEQRGVNNNQITVLGHFARIK